jgi:1,5-anhydro-D-fructose reductase (1,5-anhydro-D-mannitol-forming)
MKLHWLVIGLGDIALRRVLPAIEAEPRSVLHGVVTRDPEKGRRCSGRVWTSLDEALAEPRVDAVYVATPVVLHAPQTIAALRAGKHVLCEKPMAMNYAEARSMTEAARGTGRKLGVAYYRRMYPKLQRARALLAQGAIGQPVLAEINCHSWFQAGDGRRAWVLDPKLAGGGPLYDIASHRIDVLNFLFGEPVRVSAHLSNAVHKSAVEDSATLLIEYESGVRGVVDVRWHSRVYRDEFRIVGVDGEMSLTPLNGPRLIWPGGEEALPIHDNPHYPCIANFAAAVLDGAHLYAGGESSSWTDWVTSQAMAPASLKEEAK